jgi:Polyketide cyclase / dehydrase and lipid transport
VRTARAEGEVALTPEAALRLWTDVRRWPAFVEGFARVVEQDPEWPAAGARVVWDSVPAGRGRVTEKVTDEVGSDRFATIVFEDRLAGKQTFRAAESEGGSRVEVSLEYTLTKYGPLGALADVIFIRRALRDALRRTIFRFSVEAEEEAGLR